MKNIKHSVFLSIIECLFFHATLQTSDTATPSAKITTTRKQKTNLHIDLPSDVLDSGYIANRVEDVLLKEIICELMNKQLFSQTDQTEASNLSSTASLLPTASNIIEARTFFATLTPKELEQRKFAPYFQNLITLAKPENQVATQEAFKALVLQKTPHNENKFLQKLPTLSVNLQNSILNFIYNQLDRVNTQALYALKYKTRLQNRLSQTRIALPAELILQQTEFTQKEIAANLNEAFEKLMASDVTLQSYYPEMFRYFVLQSLEEDINDKATALYKQRQLAVIAAKQKQSEQQAKMQKIQRISDLLKKQKNVPLTKEEQAELIQLSQAHSIK